jgi:hypothetical protein
MPCGTAEIEQGTFSGFSKMQGGMFVILCNTIYSYCNFLTDTYIYIYIYIYIYTGCPRRIVPNFGSVFLMLKYIDITQKLNGYGDSDQRNLKL